MCLVSNLLRGVRNLGAHGVTPLPLPPSTPLALLRRKERKSDTAKVCLPRASCPRCACPYPTHAEVAQQTNLSCDMI